MKKQNNISELQERRNLYKSIRNRLVSLLSDPETSSDDFFRAVELLFCLDEKHFNRITETWE